MQTQIKCLAIRIPIEISNYPLPSFYRYLTKMNSNNGKIEIYTKECIYWLESPVITEKQLKWFGDIKQKILKLIPEVEIVTYEPEVYYRIDSALIFNLNSLQKRWRRKITPKKSKLLKKKDETIKLPPLVPMQYQGKFDYRMYQVLCRYSIKLHYEKLLQFEYLYCACKIYNKNSEEKLLQKQLLKLTQKAFDYISQQVEDNPDNFKQKLEPKELRRLRIKHGATVLQKANKKRRNANIIKVKEAIATNRYYKGERLKFRVSYIQ